MCLTPLYCITSHHPFACVKKLSFNLMAVKVFPPSNICCQLGPRSKVFPPPTKYSSSMKKNKKKLTSDLGRKKYTQTIDKQYRQGWISRNLQAPWKGNSETLHPPIEIAVETRTGKRKKLSFPLECNTTSGDHYPSLEGSLKSNNNTLHWEDVSRPFLQHTCAAPFCSSSTRRAAAWSMITTAQLQMTRNECGRQDGMRMMWGFHHHRYMIAHKSAINDNRRPLQLVSRDIAPSCSFEFDGPMSSRR